MNRLNPTAIAFWIFLSGIGYIIGQSFNQGLNGLVVGLVIGTGLSVLSD